MDELKVLEHIDNAIAAHSQEEDEKYKDLREDIKALRGSVQELLDMWNQTKGVLSFLKWFVTACASLGAGFVFLRDHLK